MGKERALVIDVETCGGFGSPKVYDIGYAIIERTTGRILESDSLVIYDVFFGMADAMETAYYAEKIPGYHEGIHRGQHRVVRFRTAWDIIRKAIAAHGVKRVYAYNCAFDRNALNNTLKVLSGGKYRYFFPREVKFCDIWHMACQTILKQKRYRKFAEAHGFVSEAGNLRTSAECAYAYMTRDPQFVESHTGLEDVVIETAILQKVLRQKRKVHEGIVHNPWRLAQVA